MDNLNNVISDHPALVVLAFTLFFGATNLALGISYRALKWFVRREFESLQAHQDRQDAAIGKLEVRLDRYDITFAVSQTSFDDLVKKIDQHIDKEELTIKKVDEIRDRVARMEGMMRRNGSRQR